jgi:P-type Cu+ transporter
VLEAARVRGLHIESIAEDAFESFPGRGVRCKTSEGVVLVGTRIFLESSGSRVPSDGVGNGDGWSRVEEMMTRVQRIGKTSVCVSLDGVVLGVIGMADIPKVSIISAKIQYATSSHGRRPDHSSRLK